MKVKDTIANIRETQEYIDSVLGTTVKELIADGVMTEEEFNASWLYDDYCSYLCQFEQLMEKVAKRSEYIKGGYTQAINDVAHKLHWENIASQLQKCMTSLDETMCDWCEKAEDAVVDVTVAHLEEVEANV